MTAGLVCAQGGRLRVALNLATECAIKPALEQRGPTREQPL